MKRFTLIFFAFVSIGASFAQHSGGINLSKGQKLSVDNKVTALTTQSLMGQAMESNAEIVTKYIIEVKDLKESNYSLISTFTKMKAKISAMGNNLDFDSDNKEDMAGKYASSFKGMINQPKEVGIDKSGKILHTITAKKDSISAQPDILKMMIDHLVGDPEESGYGVNFALLSMPSKITAGFNWTDSSTKDGIQKSTTYTIKEIKGNEVIITVTGILNTDVKSQMQGMDIINRSKGNLSGEQIVDLTTGVIKEKNTLLESAGNIILESQGIEIPMTTKVKFTSTVKPA